MGLYIFLGIILFLLFLLVMPLSVSATYENSAVVYIKYLFIKIRVYPKKEKKNKKEEAKAKESQKEISPPEKKQKLSDTIGQVKDLISTAAKSLKKLLKHIEIKRLNLNIQVGAQDAARTAIEYGAVSAVLYPLCNLLFCCFKVNEKKFHVDLKASFDLEKTHFSFDTEIGARLIFLIAIAIYAVCKYILTLLGNNKKEQLIKGGAAK